MRLILLDSGPLGMIANPRAKSPETARCVAWYLGLADADADVLIMVPEVAQYEVRRELVRDGKTASVARLDELAEAHGILAADGPTWRRASELWADARRRGYQTAADASLDGDVIIAASAQLAGEAGFEAIVATVNVGHLARYCDARPWETIGPA